MIVEVIADNEGVMLNICRSFKGWQKNAIVGFLGEQNIKVGKPDDFI